MCFNGEAWQMIATRPIPISSSCSNQSTFQCVRHVQTKVHSNVFVMFKPNYILNVFSLSSVTWWKTKLNTFLIMVSCFASENRRGVLRFHFIRWGQFYSFHSVPSQHSALKKKLIHHTPQRACRRQFIGLPDHVMCTIRVYSLKDD